MHHAQAVASAIWYRSPKILPNAHPIAHPSTPARSDERGPAYYGRSDRLSVVIEFFRKGSLDCDHCRQANTGH